MKSPRTVKSKAFEDTDMAYRKLRDDLEAMNTLLTTISEAFSTDNTKITPEGGLAVKRINKTGAASVKGALVATSTAVDNSVILQANTYDTIGVFYESGVADGSVAWVVVSGIADVLYKDATASTRGNILIADAVDGRASDIANPGSGLPAVDTHFKECGHVMETKAGGTNVLVKCVLHFN